MLFFKLVDILSNTTQNLNLKCMGARFWEKFLMYNYLFVLNLNMKKHFRTKYIFETLSDHLNKEFLKLNRKWCAKKFSYFNIFYRMN